MKREKTTPHERYCQKCCQYKLAEKVVRKGRYWRCIDCIAISKRGGAK